MAYPLFQSAISSSTPFPGTYAETASPTPAGSKEQQPQESAYEAPSLENIQEDQRAYEADQKRKLADLSVSRAQLLRQRMMAQNMKWSKHPNSSRWVRRQALGLNGNKDVEPPEMMYKRMQHVERMTDQIHAIDEQIRLTSQLSPYTESRLKELGDLDAKEVDVQRQMDFLNDVINPALVEMGKDPLDPDTVYTLARNRTASPQGRYGENDPIKRGIDAAKLGAEATAAAADDPSIPEPLRNIVRLGAKQKAIEDAKKDKENSPDLPVLGLYKQPKDLYGAMHTDFKDMLNTDGYYHMEPYEVPSPMPGMPAQKRERKAWSKDEIKQARAAVATRYPGYEKYFPNFVEKGFTDIPNPSAAGDQKDLDIQALRARLKAQAQAK